MGGLEVGAGGAGLSPFTLFMNADIIVKLVMIGLLAASVWTWTIIFGHGLRLGKIARENDAFEKRFWETEDMARLHDVAKRSGLPSAKVFLAALGEWRRSIANAKIDREGVRARLAAVMGAATTAEIDALAERLNVLATIGSVAPFVGLFGTVWGIMRSFSDIAASQNTSLAVVAPGIAEALFATALGLFAAIPAVIAYNRLSHQIGRIEGKVQRFADGFHATLSRELEARG